MTAGLRTGLPAADEKTISTITGKIAIKKNLSYNLTRGSVANSNAETVISQATIAADQTYSHLIVMASIRSKLKNASWADFKIKIGTLGTTADTQIGETVRFHADGLGAAKPIIGGSIFTIALAASDYDVAQINKISITAQNENADVDVESYCDSLIAIGV